MTEAPYPGPLAQALALLSNAAERQAKAAQLIDQAWLETSAAGRLTNEAYEGASIPTTTVNLAHFNEMVKQCLKAAKAIEKDLNQQVATIRRVLSGGSSS